MPRCKNCKELFKAKYFNQKFCLEDPCIKVFAQYVKDQNWNKEKAKRKKELETIQDLIKKCQTVFNTFIRLRDAQLPCVSCGGKLIPNPKYSAQYDASHYYNANNHWNLRFNEDNVNSSCVRCNRELSGNLIEYRKRLIERIGIHRVEALDENCHLIRKFTRLELRELTEYYKEKVKKIKKNLK